MKQFFLLLTLSVTSLFNLPTTKAQTLETDSLALLCLYIDTDGNNWTNNDNWLTAQPVATWHGITVQANRVTRIKLSANNLSGALSADFNNLTALNELILDQNNITGIATLSNLSALGRLIVNDNELRDFPQLGSSVLFELACQKNRLTFDDLEPLVGFIPGGGFQYAPQANVGKERFKYFSENETVHLTVTVGGSANLYFWLKDGQPVNPSPMTVPDLTIPNATETDEGDYVAEITNANLPALTLKSEPIHLRQLERDSLGGEYVPNQLIVEFTTDATQFERDTMLAYYQGVRLDLCMCGILELWQLPDTSITPQGMVIIGVEGVKEDAISKAKVEDTDKNYVMLLLDSESGTGSAPPKPTPAPPATTSMADIIPVAVIDVGIDTTISMILPWLWQNEEELSDQLDNDDNCLADDTRGYDFVNRTNAPTDAVNGHGTHLAGIIANSLPDLDIQIMNIKTHDDDGFGLLFEATCAIYYAMQQEAKVINLSWGYRGEPVAVLENAIIRAGENCGALVVTSAGNEALDNDAFPHYPSSYDLDNLISVAALNVAENGLLDESNFGTGSVDIAAPGDSIFSTLPTPQGFGFKSGTSMAAAAVSRAAALLYRENPAATYLNIIDALMTTAEPVPTLDEIASGGKLDLSAALNYIQTVEIDSSCYQLVDVRQVRPEPVVAYRVSPQPFSDWVTLELDLNKPVTTQLVIVDALGRRVYVRSLALNPGNNQIQWDGKSTSGAKLPAGLYFATLKIDEQVLGIRLLKL